MLVIYEKLSYLLSICICVKKMCHDYDCAVSFKATLNGLKKSLSVKHRTRRPSGGCLISGSVGSASRTNSLTALVTCASAVVGGSAPAAAR